MYKRNNKGPSTELCRTPHETTRSLGLEFPIDTNCIRYSKYDTNQFLLSHESHSALVYLLVFCDQQYQKLYSNLKEYHMEIIFLQSSFAFYQ